MKRKNKENTFLKKRILHFQELGALPIFIEIAIRKSSKNKEEKRKAASKYIPSTNRPEIEFK